MSTKTIRFQIEKAQVDPTLLPATPSKLRELIQDFLFDWLRKINDDCEKILKENSQAVVEMRLENPEQQKWENPSDEAIRQLVQQESAYELGRVRWSYSVQEETLYVNGFLTILFVGHRTDFPIAKWMQFPELPGFKVSEEFLND